VGQVVELPVQVAAKVAAPPLQLAALHWVPALPAGWEQVPVAQRSAVQGLPSLVQPVPSAITLQAPVAVLHTPGWQSSEGQTTARPAHTPPVQLSPVVQRLPSLQPVPSAATSQTPEALQVPGWQPSLGQLQAAQLSGTPLPPGTR
jgi:hypothetical protein